MYPLLWESIANWELLKACTILSIFPLLYSRFNKGPDIYACSQQKSFEHLIIPATIVKSGAREIKQALALSELTIYWVGADNKISTLNNT